jgi:hypothetical protein
MSCDQLLAELRRNGALVPVLVPLLLVISLEFHKIASLLFSLVVGCRSCRKLLVVARVVAVVSGWQVFEIIGSLRGKI